MQRAQNTENEKHVKMGHEDWRDGSEVKSVSFFPILPRV